MAVPIWKDYYVNLGNVSSADFSIMADGSTIYEGRAVRKPGEVYLQIKINDICEGYLSAHLPTFINGRFTPDNLTKTFAIYSGESFVQNVTFSLDYSFEYNRSGDVASSPIVPVVDINQPFIYSEYDASQIDVDIIDSNGDVVNMPIAVARQDDFNDDFNNDFAQSIQSPASGSIYLDLRQFPDIAQVRVGGITYQVIRSCNRYALYYVNAYGGWDTLLMQGQPSESDTITRSEVSLVYNNSTPSARGRKNYVNEIVKTFTLKTGLLTDAQAAKMWHLLESTNVYLYDLQTSQMHSVVITNTDAPFKTFKGEGGKLFQYDVNVELSQQRVRR